MIRQLRPLICALLFLGATAQSLAQTPPAYKGKSRIVVRHSMSFVLYEDSIDIVDNRPLYSKELYWGLSFGLDVSPFYRISLENKFLFYQNIAAPWEVGQLIGLVHEVDALALFWPQIKHRLWINAGLHRGNIRRTARAMQHGDPWLWQAHFAVGGSWHIHPNFDIDVQMGIYWALEERSDLFNYNHPSIGLSYYFQKRPTRPAKG